MNYKIIDIWFTCLVFSLPFIYIPSILWQNFLGGPFGNNLVVYPLFIGIIYTIYCQFKYKNIFIYWNKIKIFLGAYLLIFFVSLIHGTIVYPYYDQLINGAVSQIPRLASFMDLLEKLGIYTNEQHLLQLWIPIRFSKGILLEMLYTFVAAYTIFCWYHNRVQRAWQILVQTVIVSLVIIAGYGMVDVFYQSGSMIAQNILATINPILHSIYDTADWHPRLFWGGQIRSIFPEPSHLGMYMAFSMPILWWKILQESGWKKYVLLFLFFTLSFELFLTQSRTVFATQLGEFGLILLFSLYQREKKYFVLLFSLAILECVSFTGSLYFIQYQQVPVKYFAEKYPLADRYNELKGEDSVLGMGDTSTDDYVDATLLSLSGQSTEGMHAGSNHSRFTIMKTDFLIGRDHLFLGVGPSLRTAYMWDRLADFPGAEIQSWNQRIDKRGILRAGYPNLNDYLYRFSETGLLGLGIFLFPFIYVLFRVTGIYIRQRPSDIQPETLFLASVSLVGYGATGMGNSLNQMWCGWLMLGILWLFYKNENTVR